MERPDSVNGKPRTAKGTFLTMIDYAIFYRHSLRNDEFCTIEKHDIFVSAFNSSERVRKVFENVLAARKVWLVHPEYEYKAAEIPGGVETVRPDSNSELTQVNLLLKQLGPLPGMSLCIDITGFMRHVLIFLIAKLSAIGISKITVIYAEPERYTKQEATEFSTRSAGDVRPVAGMRGTNNEHAKDALILGVGFDHKLMNEVVNHKDHATVYPILGFPSLSPDMYQQSAVRAAQSGAPSLDDAWITNRFFAPANDPFATAGVVSELIARLDNADIAPNVYLSPLSTKVQALGFALYWVLEGRHRGAVSILLPECDTYARETSQGFKRMWMYEVELN
jgi:hypothetical protein